MESNAPKSGSVVDGSVDELVDIVNGVVSNKTDVSKIVVSSIFPGMTIVVSAGTGVVADDDSVVGVVDEISVVVVVKVSFARTNCSSSSDANVSKSIFGFSSVVVVDLLEKGR